VVESIAVNAGDKQIGKAVVIVVAHGYSHVEAGSQQPGLRGHVREDSIAVVAIEAVVILRRGFFQSRKVGAIGEEDVGPAIAVIVEDRNAPGHGLGHVSGGAFIHFQAKGEIPELEANR